MKLLLKIQLICIILLLSSCSDNETNKSTESSVPEEISTSNSELQQRGPDMTERYILFTYRATSEVASKLPNALKVVADANVYEISANTVAECEIMSSTIILNEGKAVVENYSYLDNQGNVLISYAFDQNLSNYIEVPNPEPFPVSQPMSGCPAGSTDLGICGYDSMLESCLRQKSLSFILDNLQLNKRVTITQTNTLQYVRVCGTAR